MNKIIYSFILFISVINCNSQTFDLLLPIQQNALWGAIHSNGQLVLQPKYEYVECLPENGIAIFMEKSTYGIIDINGNVLMQPKYDMVSTLTPQYLLLTSDSLFTVFNIETKEIFDEEFQSYSKIFNEIIFLKGKEKSMLINIFSAKSIVLECDTITLIHDNLNNRKLLNLYNNNSIALYDFNFNLVLSPDYDYVTLGDRSHWIVGKDGKYALLNQNFKTVLPLEYEEIEFEDNSYFVKKDNRAGVFSISEQWIITPRFDRITPFVKYYRTELNGKRGLIRKDGKVNIDVIYDNVFLTGANDEFFIVQKGNKFGVISENNQLVLPVVYEELKWLAENFFVFEENEKQGVVNSRGETVLEPRYNSIAYLGENFFSYKVDEKTGVVTISNRVILPPAYDNVEKFNAGLFKIQIGEKLGLASTTGEIFFGTIFQNITKYADLFYLLQSHSAEIDTVINTRHKDTSFVERPFYGLTNNFGDLILDTNVLFNKLVIDKEIRQIQVASDSGTMIIDYDASGKVLSKEFYYDLHILTIDKYNIVSRNNWRIGHVENSSRDGWGLFASNGANLIPHTFDDLMFRFNNDSNFTATILLTGMREVIRGGNKVNRRLGIVNERTAKEVLACSYVWINDIDFSYGSVARAIRYNADFKLLTVDGIVPIDKFSYIGDFKNGYARFCKGGSLVLGNNYYSKIYVPDTLTYDNFNFLKPFLEDSKAILCMNGGKWGLISSDGSLIMEAMHDYMEQPYCNRVIVKNEELFGVINPFGDTLIPFQYIFIEHLKEPLTNIWNKQYYRVKTETGWGVIDSTGKKIIEPIYQFVNVLENEKGCFFSYKQNFLWGVFNEKQEIIVPPLFDTIEYLDNDLRTIFVGKNFTDRYGYINSNGKIDCFPTFYAATDFENGIACARERNGMWGVIDTSYTFVSNERFHEIREFHEGLAAVRLGELWGVIDSKGNVVVEPQYMEIGDFHNNRAWVFGNKTIKKLFKEKKARLYGYIDENGTLVIPQSFKIASDFCGKTAVVKKYGKQYLTVIDSEGNSIQKQKFFFLNRITSYTEPDEQNYRVIKFGNKKETIMNSDGEYLVKAGTFEKIQPFVNNFAIVKYKNKNTFIDLNFKPLQLESVVDCENFNAGVAQVKVDRFWGFIDENGNIVVPPDYRKCDYFKNGIAQVKDKRGTTFFIDKNNKVLSLSTEEYYEYKYNYFNNIALLNSKNMFAYINKTGDTLFNSLFVNGLEFQENITWVQKKNSDWTMINTKGIYLLNNVFLTPRPFAENLSVVGIPSFCGIYRYNGEVIYKPEIVNIKRLNDYYFELNHPKGKGYMNKEGKIIWSPEQNN